MRYEPIIRVKIKKFAEDFGYQSLEDSQKFEFFINNLLLCMHQPEATTKNSSLLQMASVGGQNDMGIDGIAVKVNGIFVTSTKEIDDIIDMARHISVEFIFVQAKYKDKLDSGEYAKFTDGIYDFLSESHYEPHNEKIAEWLFIKDYIFSDGIIQYWKDAPIVRTYYVIFGEWREDAHIEGKSNALQAKIEQLNDYGDCFPRFLGSSNIAKICEENENSYKVVLNVLGSLEFEEVEGVSNSQVILCKAYEFIKLLYTEEGVIRKSLFMDNVRDYQGDTNINKGMLDTIENDPSSFLLLNNGITVVCSDLVSSNRKVTITNPQIVNGCQTSSVLYHAAQNGYSIDAVSVLVKIIATDKHQITNSIVKGTNSQNPVFSEAFEITREFHKLLEEYIVAVQSNIANPDEKVYYERRSKQYDNDPLVKRSRTFGLDMLAHSVVSIFLQAPHDSVLHIVNLLEKYQNSIFVDTQSFQPYYCSALLCLSFEKMMQEGVFDRKYDTYKYFIIALAAEKITRHPLNINSTKIDDSCEKIISTCHTSEAIINIFTQCIAVFDNVKDQWIAKQGTKYRHGIKDNPLFTQFFYTSIRGGNVDKIDFANSQLELVKRGVVISAKQDRAGRYYAFIQAYPDNVFFHSEDHPRIDFSRIVGQHVTYQMATNPRNGKTRAKNVKIITE
jgi:hypothetical protein